MVSNDSARRSVRSSRTRKRSTTASNRMLALAVERQRFVELVHPAVDARPDVALGPQALDDLHVLALAVADHRGEQHEALAARARHDRIHHLADRLRFEHHAMVRAARLADAGEEQPQVVVDLGDGSDRRAGIVRRRLLLDGDGGRQPLDVFDVGLLHHRQELARVGGERFDVAPLPLGVDGVERERRLARAREPRDHHQPVAGDVDVDALQVVRPGPADANEVHLGVVRRALGRVESQSAMLRSAPAMKQNHPDPRSASCPRSSGELQCGFVNGTQWAGNFVDGEVRGRYRRAAPGVREMPDDFEKASSV